MMLKQKRVTKKFAVKKRMKKFGKVRGEKVWEIPPTLFKKNAKYHVITGKGRLHPRYQLAQTPLKEKNYTKQVKALSEIDRTS